MEKVTRPLVTKIGNDLVFVLKGWQVYTTEFFLESYSLEFMNLSYTTSDKCEWGILNELIFWTGKNWPVALVRTESAEFGYESTRYETTVGMQRLDTLSL